MSETYIIGSEKLPVEVKGNFIQEVFQGSSSIIKTLEKPANEFTISNDSEENLTFAINGMSLNVKSGEVFSGVFPEFKEVEVFTSGDFRAYVKGNHKPAVTTLFTSKMLNDVSTLKESLTRYWKGNLFEVKRNINLRQIGVNIGGSPSLWSLWEFDTNSQALGTRIANGTFSGATLDSEGYARVETDANLEAGKTYILIVKYDSTNSKYAEFNDGLGGVDDEYMRAVQGIYNLSTEPSTGAALGGSPSFFLYDQKFVYSEVL